MVLATAPTQARPQRREVEKLFYRPSEAAEALGISTATVWRMVAAGTLPSRKFNANRRIPVAAIVALARECAGRENTGVGGQQHGKS